MKNDKIPECVFSNCFECPYEDCIYEQLTFEDMLRQDKFDKELKAVEPEVRARIERQKRYDKTDKGKARKKKYQQTDKFKERQKEYNSSDKGKERWRRYYQKKKLEKEKAERNKAYEFREILVLND